MGIIISTSSSGSSSSGINYENLGRNARLQLLTCEDITMIKDTWKLVKLNPEVGIQTMIRIFTAHKSIKHVWVFATRLESPAEIRNDSQVRYHAEKIISTLGSIIDKLDASLSHHKAFLIGLGLSHFNYGVKCVYFKDFEEAFIHVLEMIINNKTIFDKRTRAAWSKLILLVADHLSAGIRRAEEKAQVKNNMKAAPLELSQ